MATYLVFDAGVRLSVTLAPFRSRALRPRSAARGRAEGDGVVGEEVKQRVAILAHQKTNQDQ